MTRCSKPRGVSPGGTRHRRPAQSNRARWPAAFGPWGRGERRGPRIDAPGPRSPAYVWVPTTPHRPSEGHLQPRLLSGRSSIARARRGGLAITNSGRVRVISRTRFARTSTRPTRHTPWQPSSRSVPGWEVLSDGRAGPPATSSRRPGRGHRGQESEAIAAVSWVPGGDAPALSLIIELVTQKERPRAELAAVDGLSAIARHSGR